MPIPISQCPNCRSPEQRFYKPGSDPAYVALVLYDIQGPFLMYIFFICLALFAFCVELARKRGGKVEGQKNRAKQQAWIKIEPTEVT